ncbi:TonB-dependent receptor domain-containing protein [Alloalcanivorax sp. C16-1]|uniref:TonB-dependent receptor domain-containing protein n=1 Tax=Alloalcanivorax sp. C16-1 TaxID=3390051 RepID=UPI003970CE5A
MLHTPFPLRPALLCLALASLTLTLAGAPAARADTGLNTPQDVGDVRHRFEIAAGLMAAALHQLARAAGITLTFDPALLEGLRSDGITGIHSTDEALRRVLADSGLQVARSDNGGYLITAPAAPVAATLAPVTVSTTRAPSELGRTPQKITVIEREQIEQQLAMTTDQSSVLSSLIPSYGPSRQKLTNYGETFRGRKPLILIDGVPQSNPLRDSSREGYTIDFSMLDRIEVIHGASAEHGLGATGGIINFVTRHPEGDGVHQHAGVRLSADPKFPSDSLSYKTDYRLQGNSGNWEYLAGVSYQSHGLFYDAHDRPVGVDRSQGDIMDSRGHDLMAKIGYWFDDDQNLQFTVNRFFLEGDYDYETVDGDRATGVSTTSRRGRPEGKAPRNEVLTTSLVYQHRDLGGNDLRAQLYTQRFRARYGGGVFATFQDPAIDPTGNLFDQSQNEADKVGAKFTLNRAGLLGGLLGVTAGLDLLQDETRQMMILTDREWVPETRFRNIAPFLQTQWRLSERLNLQTGARYEYARLDVDDYTTLASYGGGTDVNGGSPSFDETLLNAGLTYQLSNSWQLFGSYAEGFGMPDVGRVIREISVPDQNLDDYLDLRPVVTDNREIGVRFHRDRVSVELSYYRSDSDLGSRLENVNGIAEVRREKTEIDGWEASAEWRVLDQHTLGASYARVRGEYDSDQDGKVDSKLDGRNVAPNQLSLHWQASWSERLRTRLQGTRYFSRSFDDPDQHFEGYNLVDLSLLYRLPKGELSAGIENLFNEDYFTYFSQTASSQNNQYFKGRGRVVSLGYGLDF